MPVSHNKLISGSDNGNYQVSKNAWNDLVDEPAHFVNIDLVTEVHNTLPVAQGGTGATTPAGARSNLGISVVIQGDGPPSDSLGNNGDYYIDFTANMRYGPKFDGLWGGGTPLSSGGGGNGGSPNGSALVNGQMWVGNATNKAVGVTPSGDVTLSNAGVMTIGNGKVTYAKMQNVSATDKVLGRSSSGAGVVEEITFTGFARTFVAVANASDARIVLGLGTAAVLDSTAFDLAGTANQAFSNSTTALGTHNGSSNVHNISAFMQTMIDDFDAESARNTLGLGNASTHSILDFDPAGIANTAYSNATTAATTALGIHNASSNVHGLGGAAFQSITFFDLAGDANAALDSALTAISNHNASSNVHGLGNAAFHSTTFFDLAGAANASLTSALTAISDHNSSSNVHNLGSLALQNGTFTGGGTVATGGFTLTISGTASISGTHTGTSSGTNTGDQTITLTGPITGSGTGTFATTVTDHVITYPKIQNTTITDVVLGRVSSGGGTVEEIPCTVTARSILDDTSISAVRTTLQLGTLAQQNGGFTGGGTIATGGFTLEVTANGNISGTNTGDQDLSSFIQTWSDATLQSLTAQDITINIGNLTITSLGTGNRFLYQIAGDHVKGGFFGVGLTFNTTNGALRTTTPDGATLTVGYTFPNSGLHILDTDASHNLTIILGSNLTNAHNLTLITGDAERSITLTGNTSLEGTNTGDQTITLTGDVTGSGTGTFTTTLATVQGAVHTWSDTQTFTLAPVFTDAGGTRAALGLGTASLNATGDFDPAGSADAANASASSALSTHAGTTTGVHGITSFGATVVSAANSAAGTSLFNEFTGDGGTGGLKGLVPAPATGDATKFLKGDGSWGTPGGGGDVTDGQTLSTGLTFPNTGLHILDTNTSHNLTIKVGSDLTSARVFNLVTGDANRTLDISAANVTISSLGATFTGLTTVGFQQSALQLGTLALQNGTLSGGGTVATGGFTLTVGATASISGTHTGTHSGTSSGTNTGDQTITLTGDVTGSGTGSFAATIATAAVTLAKMADIATARFIGRTTAGSGVPESLTVTQATAILNVFGADSGSGGVKGLAPATVSGDATKFLRGDATWATPSSSGITALTGDVTASGPGSAAATLATAQPGAHTWAATQTLTVAPVFTDAAGSRTALGLSQLQVLKNAVSQNATVASLDFKDLNVEASGTAISVYHDLPHICQGRLTLTSGDPTPTTDVTAATTVYWTPFKGNKTSLYDGTRWKLYGVSEISLALGTIINAQAYDIFIYDNGGTVTLELLEWANATATMTIAAPGVVTWTGHGLTTGNSITFTTSGALPTGVTANTQYFVTVVDANTFKLSTTLANVSAGTFITTTGSQSGTHMAHGPHARATALVSQDGILSKTGALTRRYVGTFMTTATTTTEDSKAKRFLWNYYGQVQKPLQITESTDSWTYTTATWRQKNATASNKVEIICGLAGSFISLTEVGIQSNALANVVRRSGIGLDSTSAIASGCLTGVQVAVGSSYSMAVINHQPTIGYHSYIELEWSTATGTTTWFGDNGDATILQSGMIGFWIC